MIPGGVKQGNLNRKNAKIASRFGSSKLKKYSKVLLALTKYLKSQGDLKREDFLLSQLGGDKFQNHIYFLLTLADPFSRFSEGQNFYPFWTINSSSLKSVQSVNNFLASYFKEKKTPLSFTR